ncbi:hypothetical protein Vadar_030618 [Vaccinium darrowii]|uniref:Uncharacterized protein n=1 Tax=Vaccinium darrowii TaxID=229202 RepID=A0ACB7Y2W8_9ERIC|nr:hypothetical protein Vadar_030618 [Vaccinium darrowii]
MRGGERAGPVEGISHLCADLGVENGVIKLSFLRDYLQDTDDDGDELKRKFVLFILGSFLCPTTMPAIGPSWVHVVRDVEGMKDYNWAKLTLDCLVEGIHNCKTKGHLKANGCLFLLALFYLDRVTPVGSHDVRHPSTPCLAYWGDAKIKQTLKLFEASGGYENQEADVKFNTVDECKGMASTDDTSMKSVATYLGEIKNLLVENNNLLIEIKCLVSEREKKSKAQRLTEVPRDISMEFEKHGTSNAETVASSPVQFVTKYDITAFPRKCETN